MLARLLRRTECMAQLVLQSKALTAAPKHCTNPQSFSAVPIHSPDQPLRPSHESDGAKCARKPYLEREPEPKRHAKALLELIQDECLEKVGSFIPRCHLDRAYRELCDHEGWKALSWTAIARGLGRLTCKKLLKRNGARFMAYRLPAPSLPTESKLRSAARDCPGLPRVLRRRTLKIRKSL